MPNESINLLPSMKYLPIYWQMIYDRNITLDRNKVVVAMHDNFGDHKQLGLKRLNLIKA